MKYNDIEIRNANEADSDIIAPLIADFRVYLRSLHEIASKPDLEAAKDEFFEYINEAYPIYIAFDGNTAGGYIVLKTSGGAVFAESLFVDPQSRRKGIASMLFSIAEDFADSMGSQCVFNWIHPNNEMMISFLKSKGYSTLNLIEIRKDKPGAEAKEFSVGEHKFKY